MHQGDGAIVQDLNKMSAAQWISALDVCFELVLDCTIHADYDTPSRPLCDCLAQLLAVLSRPPKAWADWSA